MITDWVLSTGGASLVALGGGLLLVAAWGVVILPDALSRQHAATKAGTLALASLLVGALLLEPSASWAWRILLLLGFLMATLPVASHVLARAALDDTERPSQEQTMTPDDQ
ncbi:MAG: monovalent cation/H(+) antiporter subunit G [Pseudomonadota bacterium]